MLLMGLRMENIFSMQICIYSYDEVGTFLHRLRVGALHVGDAGQRTGRAVVGRGADSVGGVHSRTAVGVRRGTAAILCKSIVLVVILIAAVHDNSAVLRYISMTRNSTCRATLVCIAILTTCTLL